MRRQLRTAIASLLFMPALMGCGVPLSVTEREGNYFIDVQTLGEYATTVNRLQLKAGNQVVWEIRAKGQVAQVNYIKLHLGANPSSIGPVYFGEYSTVIPADNTFVLEPRTEYEVRVWGEHAWWPSRASFRTGS